MQVHGKQLLQIGAADAGDIVVFEGRGAVDQQRAEAPSGIGAAEEVGEAFERAEVAVQRDGAAAAGFDFPCQRFGMGGGVMIVDRHRPAVGGEAAHHRRAQPRTAAGDERVAGAVGDRAHLRAAFFTAALAAARGFAGARTR